MSDELFQLTGIYTVAISILWHVLKICPHLIKLGDDSHIDIKGNRLPTSSLRQLKEQPVEKVLRESIALPVQRTSQLATINGATHIQINIKELIIKEIDLREKRMELIEVDLIIIVGVVLLQQGSDCMRIKLLVLLPLSQRFMQLLASNSTIMIMINVVKDPL